MPKPSEDTQIDTLAPRRLSFLATEGDNSQVAAKDTIPWAAVGRHGGGLFVDGRLAG